jgi:hypothetical protein
MKDRAICTPSACKEQLQRGTLVVAVPSRSFTLGQQASKISKEDTKVTWYHLSDDRFNGYIASTALVVPSTGAPAVSIVKHAVKDDSAGGGPPGGFLVLFLSPEDAATKANGMVLSAVARARELVNERCWGVLVLRPSESWNATWSAGLSLDAEPPAPTHSDLATLEFGIEALPALLLLSPNGAQELAKLCGEAALHEVNVSEFVTAQADRVMVSRVADEDR